MTEACSICLIIDAGHAKVSSELVDPKTLKEIQSKQNQKLTDKEFRRLESLMYDKFKLSMESTQVLIGSSIEETKSRLESKDAKDKDPPYHRQNQHGFFGGNLHCANRNGPSQVQDIRKLASLACVNVGCQVQELDEAD